MMMRSGGTPRPTRNDCCSIPFRVAGGMGGDRDAGLLLCNCSRRHDPGDVRRDPVAVGHDLQHAGAHRVPLMPSVMSRTKQLGDRSGPSIARPGPWNWK